MTEYPYLAGGQLTGKAPRKVRKISYGPSAKDGRDNKCFCGF